MEELDKLYSNPKFDPRTLTEKQIKDYGEWLDDQMDDAATDDDQSIGAKIKQHARDTGLPEEFARYALPEEEYLNHPHLKGKFRTIAPKDKKDREAREAAAQEIERKMGDVWAQGSDRIIPPDKDNEATPNIDSIPIQNGLAATLTENSGATNIKGVPYFRTPFGLVRGFDSKIKGANSSTAYRTHLFHLEGALQRGDMGEAKRLYASLHREDRGIQLSNPERVNRHHQVLTRILKKIDEHGMDENVNEDELNQLKGHAKREFENIPRDLIYTAPSGASHTLEELHQAILRRHGAAIRQRKAAKMQEPSTLQKIGNIASAFSPFNFYGRKSPQGA
jgi:hypothetical protein